MLGDLPLAIAAEVLAGPVTDVLADAKYWRNDVVQTGAAGLGIRLMSLPGDSPYLNPIERLRGSPAGRECPGSATRTSRRSGPRTEIRLAGVPAAHAADRRPS